MVTGRVSVEVLDGFRAVRADGSPAGPWVRPSAKRLLALLVLTPERRLGRAAAAELLFPALVSARRANALSKSVGWCRTALGLHPGEGLVAAGGQLRWVAPVDTDLDATLSLSRMGPGSAPAGWSDAASLRRIADDRRELLPGWDDDWLSDFRDEVRRARTDATAGLARLLETGTPRDLAESVRRWQGLVDDDPLDEDRHAALVRALLLAGRLDEVTLAYARCRRVLWTQLHVEPGEAVESAWRLAAARIRQPSASATRGASGPSTEEADQGGDRGAGLPGREDVLGALEVALGGPARGPGGSAVLVGDPGIGKSAVLAAVADRYRSRGWRVVACGGASLAGQSYGTIEGVLRTLLEGTEASGLVSAPLADRPRGRTVEGGSRSSERALHRRVAAALDAACLLPTVIVVDDLHAADGATMRLVRSLTRTSSQRSWSLLVAARPGRWEQWQVPVAVLGPLPDRIIETLIRGRCPDLDEAVIQGAVDRAHGNPLFAREIGALLASGRHPSAIPASAMHLVRQRLESLPPLQRMLVPLAVLAGREASLSLMAQAVSMLSGDQHGSPFVDSVQQLLDSDLVAERGGVLEASHPLVGEAASALLGRRDRARLHDLLAGLAEDASTDPRVVDHHRVQAFDAVPSPSRAGPAVAAACRGAQRALEHGATLEAAALARTAIRALPLCEPGDRTRLGRSELNAHLLLGHALAASAPAEAEAAYLNGARQAVDDEGRARFHSARAWLLYSRGQHSRAAHVYRQGLTLRDLPARIRAELATGLGWVLAREGLFEEALELIDGALGLVDAESCPEATATALDRKGMTLAYLGQPTRALATLDQALATATRADVPTLVATIQVHRGNVSGRLGDWDAGLRYLDEAVELARSVDDAYVESVAWWSRTDVLTRMGDHSGALAANEEEERALRLLDNPAHLAACLRRRRRLLAPGGPPVHPVGGRTL